MHCDFRPAQCTLLDDVEELPMFRNRTAQLAAHTSDSDSILVNNAPGPTLCQPIFQIPNNPRHEELDVCQKIITRKLFCFERIEFMMQMVLRRWHRKRQAYKAHDLACGRGAIAAGKAVTFNLPQTAEMVNARDPIVYILKLTKQF